MQDLVNSIANADLANAPLLVATLIVTTCAYYFVLCKSAGNLLGERIGNSSRADNVYRLTVVKNIHLILILGSITGVGTIGLTICCWFCGCSELMSTTCTILNFYILIFTAYHLMALVCVQSYFGISIMNYETKRMEDSVENIVAAIYLKSGGKLTGGILDLDMLRGNPNCRVRFETGNFHYVKVEEISRIYLHENSINDIALKDRKFSRRPGTFTLKSQPNEKFRNAEYYDLPEFRVIKTSRRDTSTRYVIAPQSEIVHEFAPV